MLRLLALVGVIAVAAAPLTACERAASEAEKPSAATYRQAVEAMRRCVQDAGYQVTEVYPDPTGATQRLAFAVVQAGDEAAAQTAYDACYDTHLKATETAFLRQEPLTGAARDQAMADLIGCLAEVGVEGLSPTTTDSRVFVRAIMESGLDSDGRFRAMTCMERYRAVWPPGDANHP